MSWKSPSGRLYSAFWASVGLVLPRTLTPGQAAPHKESIPRKRKTAALDLDFLAEALAGSPNLDTNLANL
jgi:hypothetical protein